MSLRIQNDSLAGALAPGAARTDEISRPGSSSSQAASKSGQPGADSIDISSLSQGIAAAGSAQDAQQAGRIRQLTALYQSGRYSVDSSLVGNAMVSQALGGLSGENN